MTIREFKTWLSVLAAAGAEIPAALALRRLEETVEEAGGQTDNDPLLDEVLGLIRKAVSPNTDEPTEPDLSPDPEAQPGSLWQGPYERFDWVLDTLTEISYEDRRWTVLKYASGRTEALDSVWGSCLTLCRGEPFPSEGCIGQCDVPNQDLAALHRIGDDPGALIFVRPSVTLVEPYTVDNLREILFADPRPWTVYRRRGSSVADLGEGRLWPINDGHTLSTFFSFGISDAAALEGLVC